MRHPCRTTTRTVHHITRLQWRRQDLVRGGHEMETLKAWRGGNVERVSRLKGLREVVSSPRHSRAPNQNKFAQSNLGRGPRRGTVAHIWHKVSIGCNGAPQIRPQSTTSRGPIPKPHYLPRPWTRPTYDAKRHPDPIRRFSTIHWTDRLTDRPIVHGKV